MSFVLMDTNILLRGAEPTHPMNADAINDARLVAAMMAHGYLYF